MKKTTTTTTTDATTTEINNTTTRSESPEKSNNIKEKDVVYNATNATTIIKSPQVSFQLIKQKTRKMKQQQQNSKILPKNSSSLLLNANKKLKMSASKAAAAATHHNQQQQPNASSTNNSSSSNLLLTNKRQRIKMLKSTPKISVTKRMCQMQKYIQELKSLNKELKYENESFKYFRKAALRSMTNFICAKDLNEELQCSINKTKELESLLSKKNEIIEKYQLLLKEISTNVNILMRDLENDAAMQEQLKKLSQIQQKSECLANNSRNLNVKEEQQQQQQQQRQHHDNNNTLSSSSDTLIDADLSFETTTATSNSQEPRPPPILDFQFRPIKQTQYKVPSTLSSFDASLSMENNCMSNQEEEEDSEEDNITLPLDDMMSITTISTTTTTNSETSTKTTTNEEFQLGLNELDQKIFRAKRLLESIKIK